MNIYIFIIITLYLFFTHFNTYNKQIKLFDLITRKWLVNLCNEIRIFHKLKDTDYTL